MGEFKPGDEVWVKATIVKAYKSEVNDVSWVGVEFGGFGRVVDVEAELARPAELDVDKASGGMPDGMVEVSRERWLEIPEDRRAAMRTQVRDFGGKAGGESIRYFEVISRG